MSDDNAQVSPAAGKDDPEATHWTAADAGRAFGGEATDTPSGSAESDRGVSAPEPDHGDTGARTGHSVPRPADGRRGEVTEVKRADAAARPAPRRPSHRTRKARLRVTRIDPWSVMKTALLFGVAGAIIFFVATWIVWGVIGASGAFDSINKAVNDLIASPTSTTKFQLSDYVNTGRVLGLTAIIGVIDAVLFTALSVLFAFLYNLAAQVMGGLELTLAED
ncbi:DUF3566 domain-containing protein [Acidipropionibacterium timonense]|uniref:DUF3566 domain-containing protein n=1 Tax=Acidipropionibacterium timonense TaxID=2161818 RepID=UPI001FD980CD|nr:DUF3566 domain-containing protein [Acidipropionibacterium timonense]